MRIVTFNANGIRSAARKGFYQWMYETAPDIVCIQELKAQYDQLSTEMKSPEGYEGYFQCAEKKGYSGVSIYSKHPPLNVRYGLGWPDFDSEGRFVQLDFKGLSIASIYMPSGSSSDDRQKFKEEILQRLKPVVLNLQQDKNSYIICGDINIAHRPADIRNWKGNKKNSGFLPQERSWMDWLLGDMGFVDAFRVVNTRPGQYSWWSNRGNAYANNVGWRLDYQIISAELNDLVLSSSIYTGVKFSDHAPVIVDYDFELS